MCGPNQPLEKYTEFLSRLPVSGTSYQASQELTEPYPNFGVFLSLDLQILLASSDFNFIDIKFGIDEVPCLEKVMLLSLRNFFLMY